MSTEIDNLNIKSEKFASSKNAMARVVRFHKTGGPEVLKIEQLDVPPPGKGEVQISVKEIGRAHV